MKTLALAILAFSFITTFAQKDSIINEGCAKGRFEIVSAERDKLVISDSCKGISYLFEGKFRKGEPYWLDGNYELYWDQNFKVPKLKGFHYNGTPVGLWQEYYPNGKLLSEGECDIIFISGKKSLNKIKISLVKLSHLTDTISFVFTRYFSDSIKSLIGYSGWHSYDLKRKGEGQGSVIFPSIYNIKNGIWFYYKENGELDRTEYYDGGRLIRTTHKKERDFDR